MRKCLRCNEKMVENLDIKVEGAGYGIKISKQGIFGQRIVKPKIALCSKCGYIESYTDEIDKIKNIEK